MPTTVMILRNLWRLRAAVAVVSVFAVLVGFTAVYRISVLPPGLESRQYEVGVAAARVLVDTPTSDLVHVAPKGSDTLAGRATLLANLMVDGVVEEAIAKRAGLRPDELIGLAGAAAADPTVPKPGPRDHALTTTVALDESGDQLPIIMIDTQAPDVEGAERLANAAVHGLTEYLDSQAQVQSVPEDSRLRVSGLGAAQAGVGVRGPSQMLALVLTIVIFTIGCAVLLLLQALFRSWHVVSYSVPYDEALDLYADEPEVDTEASLALVPGTPEIDDVDDWFDEGPLRSPAP